MKRYRNGQVWDFEHGVPVLGNKEVILGLDGGTTSTVCVCMPFLNTSGPLPNPLPVLARAVAGCSNHNSVGGTGTIAYGFTDDGREARAAGAGPVLGDWGSGYGIAAQALTAVIRAYDGRGPNTNLTSVILKNLDLSSPDELIGWTYVDPSWARIAALVPLVVSCAEAGDKVANKILLDSVKELALSVKAVVQRLGLCGKDGKDPFPLVMVGGVLEANKEWDIGKEVINCISKDYPGAYPIRPKEEPAVGAALLAWNFLLKELC